MDGRPRPHAVGEEGKKDGGAPRDDHHYSFHTVVNELMTEDASFGH